jgi:hypothetical protein
MKKTPPQFGFEQTRRMLLLPDELGLATYVKGMVLSVRVRKPKVL